MCNDNNNPLMNKNDGDAIYMNVNTHTHPRAKNRTTSDVLDKLGTSDIRLLKWFFSND